MLGIDGLNIDTVCVDEQDCFSLSGTFTVTSLFAPRPMSTNIIAKNPLTPVVGG